MTLRVQKHWSELVNVVATGSVEQNKRTTIATTGAFRGHDSCKAGVALAVSPWGQWLIPLTALSQVEICSIFCEFHEMNAQLICRVASLGETMAELYMARTCKWGVLRVMGGDVWNHAGDVLITPANNRLSGREGLDAMIHQKAGKELTQVTRNICLDMRKINAPPCAVTKNVDH